MRFDLIQRRTGVVMLLFWATAVLAESPTTKPVQHFGRVIGPDEKPVPAAQIWLVCDDGRETRVAGSAKSDANGRFELLASSEHDRIVVAKNGFGWTGATCLDDDLPDEPQDVQLAQPTTLRVKFITPDGTPAAGVEAAPVNLVGPQMSWFARLPEALRDSLKQHADAEGVCAFPAMPQGAQVLIDVNDDRYTRITPADNIVLADAAITEPPPIHLSASSEVSGRLTVAQSGEPMAGVRIGAQATHRRLAAGGWADDVTDKDGRYHLNRLGAGEYNIIVDLKPELAARYTAAAIAELRIEDGQSLTDQNLSLIEGTLIHGKVFVKETGDPVPDISIGVYGPAHPRSGAWVQLTHTDAQGEYALRVPPGDQYVYFQQTPPPGLLLGPTGSSQDLTTVEGQSAIVDFVLSVDPSGVVRGRVVDTEGHPVARAQVIAEKSDGRAFMPVTQIVRTDSDGNFQLLSRGRGTEFRAQKGRSITTEAIVLTSDADPITLVLHKDAMASVLVHVTGDDDTPAAGAKVKLFLEQGSFGHEIQKKTADDTGACIFKNLYPDRHYYVSAEADGLGVAQHKLNLAVGKQAETPNLKLPRADSHISGVVVDDDDRPIEGAEVVSNSGQSGLHTAITDKDGKFRIENIVQGDRALLSVRGDTRRADYKTLVAPQDDVKLAYHPSGN